MGISQGKGRGETDVVVVVVAVYNITRANGTPPENTLRNFKILSTWPVGG